MNNIDFLTKKEINTFVYSNIKEERYDLKPLQIDGRWYHKFGVKQAVCFFGILYEVENTNTGIKEYILHIGMSKQHPNDSFINKQLSTEIAHENALLNPFTEMKVSKNFKYHNFKYMMKEYLNTMDLKFIKTKEEKKLEKYFD